MSEPTDETADVLSDVDLVRDLQEGLADARTGTVFPADVIAADLAARRGEDPDGTEPV